jgi:hypothetical protein
VETELQASGRPASTAAAAVADVDDDNDGNNILSVRCSACSAYGTGAAHWNKTEELNANKTQPIHRSQFTSGH